MVNTALAMDFGERAAYAGKVFFIGMGTIFIALLILWGALALFRRAVAYFSGEDIQKSAPAPKPVASPAPAPVAAQPAGDDALIAVITAAVATALAEENGGAVPGFRVVSFQKVSTVSKRK